MEVWLFRLLVVAAAALFARQMLTRYRLLARAPGALRRPRSRPAHPHVRQRDRLPEQDHRRAPGRRARAPPRFLGLLRLRRLHDGRGAAWPRHRRPDRHCARSTPTSSRWCRSPSACSAASSCWRCAAACSGRAALGAHVSTESLLISAFIAMLMITFLVDAADAHQGLQRRRRPARAGQLVGAHAGHPDLHGADPRLEAPAPAAVAGDRVPARADPGHRAEARFREGADRHSKRSVSWTRSRCSMRFTCVECGRCQENCPAFATGKVLNPKKLILQNEEALLAGKLELPLKDLYDDPALWQCTTCGACQNECPVGVEHLPLIVNARRGLVSNGEAPASLVPVYNNLERRGNIWGLLSEQRQKFVASAGVEIFDPAKHDYVVWLGCAGAFEADFQKSLRALFDILRAKQRALRRAGQGEVQRRRRQAHRQRIPVPGAGDVERRGAERRRREESHHVVPALPEDARPRLPRVRLRGRGDALGGVRRGADARRHADPRCADAGHGHLSRPLLSRALRADGRRAARAARARRRDGRRARADEDQPVLLRRRRRPAVRGARSGAADQRRALRAAGGDRRRHRGDGLPVLLDHAEGRPGQRRQIQRRPGGRRRGRRHRQGDGDDRPDVVRRRPPARRPRPPDRRS